MDVSREIRIRVRQDLYAQIKSRAQMYGFKTMSAYVRDRVLRFPHNIETMVQEIYEKLITMRP